MQQKEIEKKAKEGKIQRESDDNKDNKASQFIQKRIRGILARKAVERMRMEEMQFLGMTRKPREFDGLSKDPIQIMEETRDERKEV